MSTRVRKERGAAIVDDLLLRYLLTGLSGMADGCQQPYFGILEGALTVFGGFLYLFGGVLILLFGSSLGTYVSLDHQRHGFVQVLTVMQRTALLVQCTWSLHTD